MKHLIAALALFAIICTSCSRNPTVFSKGNIQITCPTQGNAQHIADNIQSVVVNGYKMDVGKVYVVETDGGYFAELNINVSDSKSRRILNEGKAIGTWADVEKAIRQQLSEQKQSFDAIVTHVGVHGFSK